MSLDCGRCLFKLIELICNLFPAHCFLKRKKRQIKWSRHVPMVWLLNFWLSSSSLIEKDWPRNINFDVIISTMYRFYNNKDLELPNDWSVDKRVQGHIGLRQQQEAADVMGFLSLWNFQLLLGFLEMKSTFLAAGIDKAALSHFFLPIGSIH